MRSTIFLALLVICSSSVVIGQIALQKGFIPKNGFVPDERTAIAIAEAVLVPIYGKEQINSEKPLKASLQDGIWTVQGSLPKGWDGGVAIVKIAKRDARIVYLIHEQ